MTPEEFGQRPAFPWDDNYPSGMDVRTWLVGQGFQGMLAAGRKPGTAEIMEFLNPMVDAILKDLAARVPPKRAIPVPRPHPQSGLGPS